MYLTEDKSVEDFEREINEWLSEGSITSERFNTIMRYVFFRTVTNPGIVEVFRNARINIPRRFMASADESKRHLVAATLLYCERDFDRKVFEMRPQDAPREYRFATDFDIRFAFGTGEFYAPRGSEKGNFIPYLDVYRWMDTASV